MYQTQRPEVDECVGNHLRDAIAQAAELHNMEAAQALTEALELIEQHTEYSEGDFDTYVDRALEIAER